MVNNSDNFIQRLRHFLLFHKAESLEQTTDLIFAMPSFLCHKVDLCFHMFLCLTAWNNPCFKSNCDQQKYIRSETLKSCDKQVELQSRFGVHPWRSQSAYQSRHLTKIHNSYVLVFTLPFFTLLMPNTIGHTTTPEFYLDPDKSWCILFAVIKYCVPTHREIRKSSKRLDSCSPGFMRTSFAEIAPYLIRGMIIQFFHDKYLSLMSYTTLISASELFDQIANPDWVIIDCRFSLDDTERGRRDYLQAHIPGAVYTHLNEDLSGPIIPGKTGRHPLPKPETFAQTLSNWGIDAKVQVVAYDDKGGAMAAARLWWLLRWVGHDAVAILDGGWPQWQKKGYSVTSGIETRKPRVFTPRVRNDLLVSSADVLKILHNPNFRLIDSRSADRYRGENETIDPVAGHIPGAFSAPFANNLDSNGLFISQEDLKDRFQDLLGNIPPERAVFYCGSGVTASHNLLALAHAGFGDARLYAGSWSEWITNTDYPITKGTD